MYRTLFVFFALLQSRHKKSVDPAELPPLITVCSVSPPPYQWRMVACHRVTLGGPLPILTTLPVEFHFPLIRLYIRPVAWPSLSLFQVLSSVGVVGSLYQGFLNRYSGCESYDFFQRLSEWFLTCLTLIFCWKEHCLYILYTCFF